MALQLLSTRILGRCRPSCASTSAPLQQRGIATSAADDEKLTVTLTIPYITHKIDPPSQHVETTKSELLGFFTDMVKMRQLETAAHGLYLSRFIRGFLHLYGGQEAICVGSEAALTFDDAVITGYRDHCTHIGRGGTLLEVMAELLGNRDGCSQGKGGSMHMYHKRNNFYGGNGIVGAQVPLGVGVAFGQKYNKMPNVTMAMYGDGAANQGQLFEALNIAALWKLPCLFTCENNHWGMGTSTKRSAKNDAYYTRGDYVPGILVDGQDPLAIKQAVKFAKEYAIENGPLVIEMDTYRFWNHSASDAGTYRSKEELKGMREERDPIHLIRELILSLDLATAAELQASEKAIKKVVKAAVDAAKSSPKPETEMLYRHIHSANPPNFQVYGADRDHLTIKPQ